MGVVKPAYACILTLAMDLVGGKWKLVILWHLRNGAVRFSGLKRLLDGITQKMLTQQLRELEDAGLVGRMVYPVVPPKVEYSLSPEGEKLIPVLEALCGWGTAYAASRGIAGPPCPLSKTPDKATGEAAR